MKRIQVQLGLMTAVAVAAIVGGGTVLAAPVVHRGAARAHHTERGPAPPVAAAAADSDAAGAPARRDSALTLHGGQEGTVFRSLTVEGEDRVHVEFERPGLDLDLDPVKVQGLDLGSARDVLDRTTPDLVGPLTRGSAAERSPYLAHPWLSQFGAGAVARFRPEARGVTRWTLTVVNARGQAVASFSGRGEPPREIVWDGRSTTGEPVLPGLTYSYVFEAYDRAGNKRNVVGEGFRVSAYRAAGPGGPVLAFSGGLLGAGDGHEADAPILLEAATWLDTDAAGAHALRVTATARSADQANDLATRVARGLAARTIGDPARIRTLVKVEPDAPEDGVVRITSEGSR